ncbi:MAG TPA: DUF1449 family protein [Sedimentisphaerales bacterium]|jgi:hypothetical protein|nr:DUF1449 family protein [Sedimentisphaerales bacterium]HNU28916.1 DUF1449 family protein [Sedimentisphaerales bacterium]
MIEFITAAFALPNVLFTSLLLVCGLYWIMVILGVLDVDVFHIDLGDGGFDADADSGVDADGFEPGVIHSILHFFYLGEVPTMLLVSVMVLSLWTFSMLGNHYLNPEGSVAMMVAVFFGDLAISTLVLRFVAFPLRKLYILLNKDYNAPSDVVGQACRVVTTQVTNEKMGQVEVSTKGAPILLNAMARDAYVFQRGESAVVVKKDGDKGIYLIAPLDLER